MNDDFENIEEGDVVMLYPKADNPLHKKPVKAHFNGGYFFCEGSRPEDGPDSKIQ